MAEEARRRAGKGTGQGGSESSHPFKGKGKGPGKAQQKGGKGKSGPGGGPATPSAVRLDPLLEAAYQLYIAGRRADQPRVSRNAWLRNNMRSDSALIERSSESACGQLTMRPGLAPSRPRPRRVSRSRPLPVSRLLPRGLGPGSPTTRGKRRPPQPPARTHLLLFLPLRRQRAPPQAPLRNSRLTLRARPPGPEGRRGKPPVPKARPTHSTTPELRWSRPTGSPRRWRRAPSPQLLRRSANGTGQSQ